MAKTSTHAPAKVWPAARRAAITAEHHLGWGSDFWQDLEEWKVRPGMVEEQVWAINGRPDQIWEAPAKGLEVYFYPCTLAVLFKHGRVRASFLGGISQEDSRFLPSFCCVDRKRMGLFRGSKLLVAFTEKRGPWSAGRRYGSAPCCLQFALEMA